MHEIEFLALFAFIARERERLRATTNPRVQGKFTRSDLEMAYAFRQQLGPQRRQQVSPLHAGAHGNVPLRKRNDQRASYYVPKSHTAAAISGWNLQSPPKMVAQSMRAAPSRPGDHPSAFGPMVPPQQLFQHSPSHRDQGRRESQGYQEGEERIPLGERLARRAGQSYCVF